MRIGIDMCGVMHKGSAYRGIGRYGRDLTLALVGQGAEHEFVLYGYRGEQFDADRYREWEVMTGNARFVELITIKTDAWKTYRCQALDDRICEQNNPDRLDALILLSPHQSFVDPACSISTLASVVYDLIPEVFPDRYLQHPTYAESYEAYLKAISLYSLVFSMSEHCRMDFIKRRRFSPEMIVTIGTGLNPHFSPTVVVAEQGDLDILKSVGVTPWKYVFHVGHEDTRKGVKKLIQAFAMLPPHLQIEYPLVLTYGASDYHSMDIRDHAREAGVRGTIIFTGWLDDNALRALYRHASCMVFPSEYEGFGLPILEAMQCGCPVVYGNNSAQPEVAGASGVGVDRNDPFAIRDAIREFVNDDGLRREHRKRGLAELHRFDWARTATTALNALVASPDSRVMIGEVPS